jgi:hypothetical protein
MVCPNSRCQGSPILEGQKPLSGSDVRGRIPNARIVDRTPLSPAQISGDRECLSALTCSLSLVRQSISCMVEGLATTPP